MTCRFNTVMKVDADFEDDQPYYHLSKQLFDSNGKDIGHVSYSIKLSGVGYKSYYTNKLMTAKELFSTPEIRLPKRFGEALLAYAVMKTGEKK